MIWCKLNQNTCMCNLTLPHPKLHTTNNIYAHIIPSLTLSQGNVHYPNILLSSWSGLLGRVRESEVFDHGRE